MRAFPCASRNSTEASKMAFFFFREVIQWWAHPMSIDKHLHGINWYSWAVGWQCALGLELVTSVQQESPNRTGKDATLFYKLLSPALTRSPRPLQDLSGFRVGSQASLLFLFSAGAPWVLCLVCEPCMMFTSTSSTRYWHICPSQPPYQGHRNVWWAELLF